MTPTGPAGHHGGWFFHPCHSLFCSLWPSRSEPPSQASAVVHLLPPSAQGGGSPHDKARGGPLTNRELILMSVLVFFCGPVDIHSSACVLRNTTNTCSAPAGTAVWLRDQVPAVGSAGAAAAAAKASIMPRSQEPGLDAPAGPAPSLPLEPLQQQRQVGSELGPPQQAALPAGVP